MTIGRKLQISNVTMLVVGIAMTTSALYSIRTISRELHTSTGATAEKLALAGNLKAAANIMRTGQRGILLNGFQHDAKATAATEADYAKKKENALALIAKIEPLLDTQERRLVDQLRTDISGHVASFRQITVLCNSGKLQEALLYYKEQ